ATVSKQVASLQLRLTRARFVEEAELKDGVVGLGTEVVLESEQDMTTYWILGEGEHHHGEHVISFQTPVARALMGHTIGDEIDLEAAEGRRRYRVVSIERRLPPHEAGTETAAPACPAPRAPVRFMKRGTHSGPPPAARARRRRASPRHATVENSRGARPRRDRATGAGQILSKTTWSCGVVWLCSAPTVFRPRVE